LTQGFTKCIPQHGHEANPGRNLLGLEGEVPQIGLHVLSKKKQRR